MRHRSFIALTLILVLSTSAWAQGLHTESNTANAKPDTARELCTVPAAPTVGTEQISRGTGNFTSGRTYSVRVRIGNRNGWTLPSPPTFYTPASGSNNRIIVQLSDSSYRSGCYKYQVEVSATGANGKYYPARAWTLPAASIRSWKCNVAKLCTITTAASHGFIPGEYVTISGVATGMNSTSINGSFTLVGQQTSSPTTLFFFRSGGTADSSSTPQGAATVIAGLGSDDYSHLAPGDFIVATVPTDGSAFPNINTATIDPDQVELNAKCNYIISYCTNGWLLYREGSIKGTTPLIVSNQQTILGVNSAGAYGKSQRSCAWADPNLACVMVMGTANGVRIEGLDIQSAGHGLMFFGAGPGYGSSNAFIRNNSITTGDLAGRYSAIYIHGGVWYDVHFENNLLTGGLADVQIDAISGGWLFFSGARWNAANLSSHNLSTNAMLAQSSVSDPDRGIIRAGFSSGFSTVEISNLIEEGGTGVIFDVPNIGLGLKNVTTADSAAIAGTPALLRVGTDANTTASGWNFHIEDSIINAVSGVPTGLQVVANTGSSSIGYIYVSNSSLGGQTNEIDLDHTGASFICVNGSRCNTYEKAPGHAVINATPGVNAGFTFANNTIGTAAGEYAINQLSMGTRFAYKGNADGWYFYPLAANHWGWWGNEPAACASPPFEWWFLSGAQFNFIENDCATRLFQVNASRGVNTVTHYGTGFRFNSNQSGSSYFTFAGTPSVARTITWADASGTVGLVLTGTTGSLGGSALRAGACTSGTVSVMGATAQMAVSASPADDPGAGFSWMGFVSAIGTVTVRVCAITPGTPRPTTYNIRVIQ